jgi:hypothetical protein
MSSPTDKDSSWLVWCFPLTAAVWLLLLAASVGLPFATESSAPGDDLTRNTVRLALLFYAAAASLLIGSPRGEVPAFSPQARLARWLWTLAWAAYLVHVAMAFHYVHHWSHAEAVEHTRQVSNFGAGIYFSHLFTVLWSADVLGWWLWPRQHAARPAWVGWALYGYMAFIIFNATVVFETGWIRWAGVLLFATLTSIWVFCRRRYRAGGTRGGDAPQTGPA